MKNKENSHKTTEQHFNTFKKECLKWIEVFGLKNWEINIFHTDHESFIAWSSFGKFAGKIVDIHLNKIWRWQKPPDNYEIRKCAFHEVCEILLRPVAYLGECRYLSDSEMSPAIHDIIHILENALWGKNNK